MYNNRMHKMYLSVAVLILLAGCATAPVYDPIKASTSQTFMLNETGLKAAKPGMTQGEIHALMGQSIVIGYSYAHIKDGRKDGPDATPITIDNPYKTVPVKTAQGDCFAEYYVTVVHQPDGIVSDDEMVPLVFCNGVLTSKGLPKQ